MAKRKGNDTGLASQKKQSGYSTEKAKKAGKRVSNITKPEKMSLEQWQVALRKQVAQRTPLAVEHVDEKWASGEFLVTNAITRRVYKVVYRGEGSCWNYCSCLDFKTSRLGTCKHIEAVKLWLEDHPTLLSRKIPPYTSVYLSYVNGRKVMLRIGSENAEAFALLARDYFDADMCLLPDAIDRFPTFLAEAKKISDTFRCYDDALSNVIARRDDKVRQALAKTLTDDVLNHLLRTSLFPYQMEGVRFAVEKGRTVIADEMGLGKTIQAIATAEVLRRNSLAESVIVACPNSLKYQWKREIERFVGAEALVIEGEIVKRRKLYDVDVPYKIVSYHTLNNDVRYACHVDTDIFILDEVQRLKNWDTQIAISARRVNAKYVVALSGTPLENKLEELYSVMELVDQYCLAPFYDFRDRYIIQSPLGKVMGYRNLNEIGDRISSRLIRRRKSDVAIQLPERQDKNLFVPMTQKQMDAHEEYKSVVAQLVIKWQKNHFLSETDHKRLLLNLNMMRMVSDSTYILDQQSRNDTKVDEAANIIKEYIDENPANKVVVFSQWERMARLIAAELNSRGIAYEYLHGGVPSVKRGKMVANFQDNPECKVFLSTDAGSTGLNLQSASLIINVDLPWNPAVLEQRIGRIYRYGQSRNIMVINLVSKDTIEENMIGKLRFKQNMFEGVLDGGEDSIFVEEKANKIVELADSIINDLNEETTPKGTPEAAPEATPEPHIATPADIFEAPDPSTPFLFDDDEEWDEDDYYDDYDEWDDYDDGWHDNAEDWEGFYEEENEDEEDDEAAEEVISEAPTNQPANPTEEPVSSAKLSESPAGEPSSRQQEASSPQELISQGISFFSGLAKTLQSPKATGELVNAIVKEDPQTGKTYLNIPVPDTDTVQKALTLLSTLFPQK